MYISTYSCYVPKDMLYSPCLIDFMFITVIAEESVFWKMNRKRLKNFVPFPQNACTIGQL